MNNHTKQFWDNYWSNLGEKQPSHVDAFQFGDDPDWLASLVVEGKKTATCSGYIFYELEKKPLPQKRAIIHCNQFKRRISCNHRVNGCFHLSNE